ncbi:hypothetical protein C8R47DRAFT_754357 [Mycena vitilis]|nr:hypothetical protein C8R47DRAFT_754357 [Mycena vitilis]
MCNTPRQRLLVKIKIQLHPRGRGRRWGGRLGAFLFFCRIFSVSSSPTHGRRVFSSSFSLFFWRQTLVMVGGARMRCGVVTRGSEWRGVGVDCSHVRVGSWSESAVYGGGWGGSADEARTRIRRSFLQRARVRALYLFSPCEASVNTFSSTSPGRSPQMVLTRLKVRACGGCPWGISDRDGRSAVPAGDGESVLG